MAEITGISWCDATVNFWHGCKKVSEGCKYCYMYRDKDRYKQDGNVVLRTKASTIKRTLSLLAEQDYNRKKEGNNDPLKIFTCSWSDFFIDEADSWREEAWDVIRSHPQYVWIILTKRIERVLQCLPEDWGQGWDHVWLVASTENQDRFDERVPILAQIPAKVRGVSIEPFLGPIDMLKNYPVGKGECHFSYLLDWVILGGESGNETGKWLYRPSKIDWFHQVRDQVEQMKAEVYGPALFVKQLGTAIAKEMKLKARSGDNIQEFPPSLQIQKFPGSHDSKLKISNHWVLQKRNAG